MADTPELLDLFEAAVRFFETGDEEGAAKLFTRYLEAGGTRAEEARRYLMQCRPRPEAEITRSGGEPEFEQSQDNLWRRPHMEVPAAQPLQPGENFTVHVYTDMSDPLPGEISQDVSISAAKSEMVFDLEVTLLATPHFQITGPATQTLRIERNAERSATVEFAMQVTAGGLTTPPSPGLTAVFFFNGRPAGSVSRRIDIAGVAVPAKTGEPPRPAIRVEVEARPADLTVIIAATPENDNRHFLCTVRTPLLTQFADGVSAPWNLPDAAMNIVQAAMNEFTGNLSKRMRIASLRGAGLSFFRAAPQVFRDAFWALIDSGLDFHSIAILTAEPFIPWELMIPQRPGPPGQRPETRQPLGVEFTVGRWTDPKLSPGLQAIPLKDSFIIAPAFAGAQALPQGQKEAVMVQGRYPGDVITPATGDNIDDVLGRSAGRSLLHIVCHGNASTVPQTLLLDNNQKLSVFQLCGLEGVANAFQTHPFVFLNACEVGRLAPALSGPDGFAPAFIQLGAAAVVAPLWSVMDTTAFIVAESFYQSIEPGDPAVPLASLLQKLRAKAYDPDIGDDTYAAYCFYGDPLAVAV